MQQTPSNIPPEFYEAIPEQMKQLLQIFPKAQIGLDGRIIITNLVGDDPKE